MENSVGAAPTCQASQRRQLFALRGLWLSRSPPKRRLPEVPVAPFALVNP